MDLLITLGVYKMLYTREQALDIFAVEYCRQQRLAIPVKAIKPLIEGKMVETHNAFYLRDTTWKLDKIIFSN